MTIFTANPRASKLNTIYLDAFAGTGFRTSPIAEDRAEESLCEDALEDPDTGALKEGSAYVALRTDPPFGHYIFVDRNPKHAQSLDTLRHEFPELTCESGTGKPTGTRTGQSSSSILTGCRWTGPPWRP